MDNFKNEEYIVNPILTLKCIGHTIKVLSGINKKDRASKDCIEDAIKWLCLAQDIQPNDGGVSLRYSTIKGWDASYPETTGYIIPTFIQYADLTNNTEYLDRAIKMADWECAIQNDNGSFCGGAYGSGYNGFVFDTGQIVFGLIDAHRKTGESKYKDAALKAANWLIQVQDSDGKWSKNTFNRTPHTYYARVAWALAELGTYTNEQKFLDAAERNIKWVLSKQLDNGWFDCSGFSLNGHKTPFTHTIAYTVRGVLETGLCLRNNDFIKAAEKSINSLISIVDKNGSFKGTYDYQWNSSTHYSCLTGNAQISICFLRYYMISKNEKYLTISRSINKFLTQLQIISPGSYIHGAIPGSFPIWGNYQKFAFPNWGIKFFIEALLTEESASTPLMKELSTFSI